MDSANLPNIIIYFKEDKLLKKPYKKKLYSKGFWQWCISLRIA
jgi:hypothetical protein